MTEPPVPREAVAAAAPAVHRLMCLFCSEPSLRAEPPCHRQADEVDQAAARFILTAAAPLIAAAERDRITALVAAWTPPCGSPDCEAWSTRDQIAAMIRDSG